MSEPATTGADAVLQGLVRHGVKTVFAYPGGTALPILQALTRFRGQIRTILPRQEQGGGFAALGLAHSTGQIGVCVATSGPGATNLLPCLADAQRAALPFLAITGQVSRPVLGTDAFQEIPIINLCRTITKHQAQVRRVTDLPRLLREALHVATTGRPGPVLLDIPKDVQNEVLSPNFDEPLLLPAYRPERWEGPRAVPEFAEEPSCPHAENVLGRLLRLVRRRGQWHDTFLTTGVGPQQAWVARGYRFPGSRHWVRSDGLSAIGFAVPAALGVLAANPNVQAVAIEAPDGFLCNVQELASAFCERLPVKVILLRRSGEEDHGPDHVLLARGFRADATRVSDPSDLDAALTELLDRPGPALLEVALRETPDDHLLSDIGFASAIAD